MQVKSTDTAQYALQLLSFKGKYPFIFRVNGGQVSIYFSEQIKDNLVY